MGRHWVAGRTRLSRLLQKLAMSSAMGEPATGLLQKDSKASFSALWKSELLWKHSTTYCTPQAQRRALWAAQLLLAAQALEP